jgi:hypothetical protein
VTKRIIYLSLCTGLLLTTLPTSGISNSSLVWNYESIIVGFGSQINWNIQGYFEQDEATVSNWTTVGLIYTTNDEGETVTYETTGSGTTIHTPDHELIISLISENIFPKYELLLNNETSLNDHFSTYYDNDERSLNLHQLTLFLFPTIIDNNSKQVNVFGSESNLLEHQSLIRTLLNLSTNSTFEYEQGTGAPIVIHDINDKILRYHNSGVLNLYMTKNSTHNIKIELDDRYVAEDTVTSDPVVDNVASDFPFSAFVTFGFVLVIILKVRSLKKL